jgi:hypothetical protein
MATAVPKDQDCHSIIWASLQDEARRRMPSPVYKPERSVDPWFDFSASSFHLAAKHVASKPIDSGYFDRMTVALTDLDKVRSPRS